MDDQQPERYGRADLRAAKKLIKHENPRQVGAFAAQGQSCDTPETDSEAAYLSKICNSGQGYLFGHPMPEADFGPASLKIDPQWMAM